MNINKNNYEAFFLDYHEGNLSPEQVAELLLFVEQHSELREAFESFENFTLEDYSTIQFENKSSLKKEISDDNREEYFIRAVENTLNTAEKELLTNYLKQHPQFLVDYHLFQKTKLEADASIVLETKDTMKKDLAPSFTEGNVGEALISLVEGLLTETEQVNLQSKIATNIKLQKELSLYQQTKLIADATIQFENKEALKRKERRVIPLFYYMATAAAVLLLFGLYFLNHSKTEEEIAATKTPVTKHVKVASAVKTTEKTEQLTAPMAKAKKEINTKENNTLAKHNVKSKNLNAPIPPVEITKEPMEQKPNSVDALVNNNEPMIKKEEPEVHVSEPILKRTEPALTKQETTIESQNDYLTLKEIAVAKLKETTLDKTSLEEEKKAGRLKTLSGWDLARAAAKGINTLTGSNLKLNPKYNDKGDVTAYAFEAGSFAITRGR
ncbi:MAG: hypothetical protein WCP52_12460 [Bacteroidota bacterium]